METRCSCEKRQTGRLRKDEQQTHRGKLKKITNQVRKITLKKKKIQTHKEQKPGINRENTNECKIQEDL